MLSGASQNAFHFSFSMRSGVRVPCRLRNAWACAVARRRIPLVTWNSGVRFLPRASHSAPVMLAASSRTTGSPFRIENSARNCWPRSPRHLTSSTSSRTVAVSPSSGL